LPTGITFFLKVREKGGEKRKILPDGKVACKGNRGGQVLQSNFFSWNKGHTLVLRRSLGSGRLRKGKALFLLSVAGNFR
jgi:hypothetical protein